MIRTKKDYQRYIQIEKDFYFDSYPNFTYELKKIFKFILLYRKVEYYHNCRKDLVGILYQHFLTWKFQKLSLKYQIFLPLNVIEEGLCIVHIGPIYINSNAKIGKYLKIHPMTTIGKTIGRDFSSPQIGDGVWIGPSVRIYGKIQIGDRVVIGTNSVVNHSVDADCTVAGNAARIINHKGYSDYFHENNKNIL